MDCVVRNPGGTLRSHDLKRESLQAADPQTGSAAFLFVATSLTPTHEVVQKINTKREVTQMGAKTVMDLIDEATIPCRTDPDLWFAESPEDVEVAKALCGDCPIQQACLARALEREEPWGVWGGELILRGVVVPRKRPRGRPRKTPVAA
ncbi:transcriptional regulator WhiB [Planobispora rosea]|uniref:Transcriptional regulator WhiB n=2 Tax=Planobispora rosea TaxID=35762 RepID=A0A8J3WD21_PLARO|nr:transcriptional regulator WhiB [Planobispora rosea]GIH84830.1 transcriptional regulator WhiB [Planobispora rosea]